jgi:hypothetical protein
VTSRILTLAAAAVLALPASAWALAGGATGGGGGGGYSGGGGGSYSGGSGSGEGGGAAFLIVVLLFVVFWGASYLVKWSANWRRAMRVKKVHREAAAAHLDDGYWDPAVLEERVREAFFPIQESWEKRDVGDSRPYVSDALFERHKLQLEGLEKQNRVNHIKDLKLHTVELVRMYNVTDDGEDRFVARITCSARDWVEDIETNQVVNGNRDASTDFEQYWSFSRHPQHGWVLDEIQQGSEGRYHEKAEIVNADEGPRIDETAAPASG